MAAVNALYKDLSGAALDAHVQKHSGLIIKAVMEMGVPEVNAKLIASQAIHESNKFRSDVFVNNKNAVGMKVPRIRKSPYILGSGTAAPASEGATPYAKFAKMEDSARDVVHWNLYNKVNWAAVATPEAYTAWLGKKGYYGDPESVYLAGLRAGYNRIKDLVFTYPKTSVALLIAGIGLVGLGVFFAVRRAK